MNDFFLGLEKDLESSHRRDKRYSKKKAELIDWEYNPVHEYSDYTFRTEYIKRKFYSRSVGMFSMLTHPQFPSEVLDTWKKRKLLKVASYGSGPGSDLIGFLQFCKTQNIAVDLQAFDTESGWDITINQLNELCNTNITFTKIQEDLSSNLMLLCSCDVLILSWVIHLIKADGVLQQLLSVLPETTILLRDRFGSSLYTLLPNCTQVFLEDTFEDKKNQQIVLYNNICK